jgi:hypothetical protein
MKPEDFLVECEAKASEAIAIADDADYGPWGVILLPEDADEFDQDAIVMSDHISITDKYKHGEMKPCNARFTAHARTSNPDLAARVTALVAMVRERDTQIACLRGTIDVMVAMSDETVKILEPVIKTLPKR